MTVRKYVVNGRVIGSVLGVIPTLAATRKRPLGVRVGVLWLAWAGSVAVALVTVRQLSREKAGERP